MRRLADLKLPLKEMIDIGLTGVLALSTWLLWERVNFLTERLIALPACVGP